MSETLEPALEALTAVPGRLLRAAGVPAGEACWRELLLTFDVATLHVSLSDESGELRVELGAVASDPPDGLEPADEEEPWWAVLGNPCVHAWQSRDPSGRRVALALQLRDDGENPRILSFVPVDGRVRVSAAAKTDPS